MFRKVLFFLLLFSLCTPLYGTANKAPSLSEIQHLIEEGDSTSAVQQLKQLVKAEPKHFQAWFLLGVNQAEQRQFDDAIVSFQQVIALQPKLAEPHNNLAVIYNEMGNYRAAIEALEASLALKPGYATAQENIGDLYIKLAADAYHKVLAKHQNPALQQRYQRLLNIHSDNDVASIPTQPTKNAPAVVKKAPITVPVVKPRSVASQYYEKSTPAIKAALKAIEGWRLAWSSKDMQAYFAAYSDEFQYGDKYPSLAKWKDYKTWAIRKRSYIQVEIEQIVSTALADNVVKLEFLQHFKSDTFNSDNRKEMLLRKTNNGWKIIYEASM